MEQSSVEHNSIILETKDLCKAYNGHLAVDHVNMHINQGDVYGFVGENGAGKTTVIRLVTGLAEPTMGSYSLFGIDSKDPKIYSARKKMGGIVESVSVNRGYTALENMKVQCIIANSKKSNDELIEIINSVGLDYEEIKNKKAGNFSLGMRQRLGIAMLLISDPQFILLDEPLNGLDPQGIADVRNSILNLAKKGITILVSSHILAELDKVCNKIGIISHGALVEEITIDELRKRSEKHLVLRTNDNTKAIEILKTKLELKDITIDGEEIFVKDDVDMNNILKTLVNENILVKNIENKESTIEDYYFKKVSGGKSNE